MTNKPTYLQMAHAAISELKDRKGSSLHAIQGYVLRKYEFEYKQEKIREYLKAALRKGLEQGYFKTQENVTGLGGSFKLNKENPFPKSIIDGPKVKEPAKKPASKKTVPSKKSPGKKTARASGPTTAKRDTSKKRSPPREKEAAKNRRVAASIGKKSPPANKIPKSTPRKSAIVKKTVTKQSSSRPTATPKRSKAKKGPPKVISTSAKKISRQPKKSSGMSKVAKRYGSRK